MSHTFLLEIGLEEIPAHVVTPSVNQLVEKTKKYLNEQKLSYDDVLPFSTPRRLAIKITGLADKQPDIEEEAKGPAKKIAYDKDGNWSKAAQGFARGQGVSTDDIFFKELKGVEYVYVKKFIAGQTATQVLAGLKDVAMDLKFPTMMRWQNNDFEYVRPLRWLVALLDDEVIDFDILGIKTGRQSQGHRFLGQPVEIKSASDYPEVLENQFVIADAQKRKNLIVEQINALAKQNDWNIEVDSDLLEEVNNLVEYPTVFAGSFDTKYLEIPDEVLITSMKDHQRFFYVTDKEGKLLPNFVSVRNGNSDFMENVISGNEKVLTARLEDAKFFYQEDQQNTIDDYVERLKKVMFHDKIGTIYQKMERVRLIAKFLGEKFGLSAEELKDLDRAAQIYKFDLVTGMVGEFSELQGVMGEIYARMQGETENVSIAMREEYMPTSANGDLPKTNVGSVLSIADKIDSIQAFFAAGMLPSGSNDPYALRRQALGIVRIALDKQWEVSLPLLRKAVANAYQQNSELYAKINPDNEVGAQKQFFADRLSQVLAGKHVRHDILETVIANTDNSFDDVIKAADILTAHVNDDDFKETIEALTRVSRMAVKAQDIDVNQEVNPELFENDAEKALFDKYQEIAVKFNQTSLTEKFDLLASLRSEISAYFEETMVMAKDETIKNNRLLQLKQIYVLTTAFGDLNNLNVK